MINLCSIWSSTAGELCGDQRLIDHIFNTIQYHYNRPYRHYHTFEHLTYMFQTAQKHNIKLSIPQTLAIFCHDLIYNPKASDNEYQSMLLGRRLLKLIGGSLTLRQRVGEMVMATINHRSDDFETQQLLDLDLAVLGGTPEQYQRYLNGIKQEYYWLSEAQWRIGRQKVINHFLAKPRIFHHLKHLEGQARENLRGERDILGV